MEKPTIKTVVITIVSVIIILFFIFKAGSFYQSYLDGITNNEAFMRITVMVISSIITVFAMLVALFKEDIRGVFVRPKLTISKENKLKELTQKTENNIEAIDYFYKIFIQNVGNIPAKEVEIYLNSLTCKKSASQYHEEIEVDGVPLTWLNSDSKQIMIPRNSKKSLTLFKILPPNEVSTPDQSSSILNKPKLKIGTNEYCVDNELSDWVMSFAIYSDNAKPISIQLKIKWNGKWESRLTEMHQHVSIEEEIKNV
ncbi:hypothetical protein [Acinetobacter vivianii]|uniref:hypothetical protein n=1 Tax=Acinetobacter vivianii TaxID=1776742 RepID=UPI004042CE22